MKTAPPEGKERRGGGALGRTILFVVGVAAASRLLYLAVGLWVADNVAPGGFQSFSADVPYGTQNLWTHWDGEHYVKLAAGGYLDHPDNVSPAFFPFYPLVMRTLATLFGGPLDESTLAVWGTLVSLAALPFALFFVYRITEHGWGEGAARAATLCLTFFPTTFYLNAVYTESLFLALSAGAVWAVRVRRDLLLACGLAALAAATRNVGVFLLVPLAYEWLVNVRRYRWQGAYLLLAPSGLLIYMSYLWWRFGEPLLFYTTQGNWARETTGPLAALLTSSRLAYEGLDAALDPGHFASVTVLLARLQVAHNATDLLFLVLAVAVLIAGLRTIPPHLSLYALLTILPGVMYGKGDQPLMGMPRYVLVAFPVFVVLGIFLSRSRALGAWIFPSTVASVVLCAMFASWRFVA